MNQSIIILLLASFTWSCNQTKDPKSSEKALPDLSYDIDKDKTNDFYDDAEPFILKGKRLITIDGEIANPGEMNIEKLSLRSLIVKEAHISGDSNKFIGAYRYDGYSLYDILNEYKLKKKNFDSFKPIIDLYVIVENDEGDKVVLSWGELYYPANLHNIIIATRVTRIVPSKTNDLWPLPETTKLIISHDLLTERNITNPVKISIVSDDIELIVRKGLKPMYAPEISLFIDKENIRTIKTIPKGLDMIEYEAVFYGRGRGIHSTTPFNGFLLKDILKEDLSVTKENICQGIFIISAEDGYRGVFTFSEIFNRTDQSELLLISDPSNMDGGAFRLFPSFDFFSDRAIKSVNGIYFKSHNP